MTKNDYVNDANVTIVHEFQNEYNEEFILYTIKHFSATFITGSELDWEGDYEVDSNWRVAKYFGLSKSELAGVKEYFNK